MNNNIIPFPLEKTSPGILSMLEFLIEEAKIDKEINNWSSLSKKNPDRISFKNLMATVPDVLPVNNITSIANIAKDFSVLSLYSIHTDQWNRKDLLGPLMELQSIAEKIAPTKLPEILKTNKD